MVCGWKYSAYFGSIFVDNEEANKSISKTEEKAEGLGSKLGAGIKTAAKWGAAIGAGALAAGTAMFGMANKATDALDRIDKLSQKIGLSRQGFQEWSYILSQNGTDIEKLQVGFKTLSNQMEMAEKGSGKGAENFKKLGISVTDATGALKSQEQVFEETVKALQAMPEGAEKSKLAMDLFGRAGQELMPLLNGTTESMEELRQKAHDMGMVISDEAVDSGVKFQDTMDDLKRSFGAVVTNVGAALIPIFQSLADWIIKHMPLIQKIIGTVFEFLQKYVGTFIDIIKFLINVFTDFFTSSEERSDKFMQYFNKFKDWFKEVFNLIVELVKSSLESIKAFWDKHGESIIAVAKSIWDIIKVVIDTTMKVIKDIIKVVTALIRGDWEGVWEGIKSIVATVWEGIKNLVRLGIEGIKNIINLAWDVLKSAFDKLWTSVSDWFMGLVDDAIQWGKNVVEGLWNGISGMVGWIGEKIKGFAEGIANGFKNFFGIASPSKLMAEYGKNIDEGLAKGIEDNQNKPLSAITAVGEKMANTAKNIANSIIDMLSIDMNKGTYSIGDVSYNTKTENQRYQDRKQKDLKEYEDEITDIAKRQGVDLSVAYDMWQQNEVDKLMNKVPKYAQGTNFHPGGLAIVGEKGPEIIDLQRGSKVYNNQESLDMLKINEERLANAIVAGLKAEGLSKPANIFMNGKAIGKAIVKVLDSELNDNSTSNIVGKGELVW